MEEKEVVNLIIKAKNNDDNAVAELLTVYKSKVNAISNEYFLQGADRDDLIQEGMIGLYKAIKIYEPEKNHNFSAFASMCIQRAMLNAVKNANRMKNSPLNSYVPIKYFDGSSSSDEENVLKLVIVDDESNIEQNILNKETNAILLSKVKEMLTHEEYQVFVKRCLNNESYSDISKSVNLPVKKIDNMLQSIKKKLKAIKGDL